MKLELNVGGLPQPSLHWWKDAALIDNSFHRYFKVENLKRKFSFQNRKQGNKQVGTQKPWKGKF